MDCAESLTTGLVEVLKVTNKPGKNQVSWIKVSMMVRNIKAVALVMTLSYRLRIIRRKP